MHPAGPRSRVDSLKIKSWNKKLNFGHTGKHAWYTGQILDYTGRAHPTRNHVI